MTDITLKPCPFCGGTAVLRSAKVAEDAMTAWVQCTSCGVNGRDNEDAYADFATAAADWNFRPTEATLAAENEAMSKTLAACYWYWPAGDTSSECCRDCEQEVVADAGHGVVVEIARGGVVEVTHCASLPPAEDADDDDDFWVQETTAEAAEAKLRAEITRRAALEPKGGDA